MPTLGVVTGAGGDCPRPNFSLLQKFSVRNAKYGAKIDHSDRHLGATFATIELLSTQNVQLSVETLQFPAPPQFLLTHDTAECQTVQFTNYA